MGRYICEVNKDNIDNEIKLVHANRYELSKKQKEHSAIKFDNKHEFHKYLKNHCISEETLREEAQVGNNIFTFLFWLLLLIFIITIIVQVCNGKGSSKLSESATQFGRFSF